MQRWKKHCKHKQTGVGNMWKCGIRNVICGMGAAEGDSADKLRHPRSDAYSAEQVRLNKLQIWCGDAYLHGYP